MRILHIEDQSLFREAMLHLIRGFDPDAVLLDAADAGEALGLVSSEPDLDLILLDLGLPGPGGLGIMPMLIDKAPTVPIIVLSAAEDPERIRSALQLGAAGFIHKAAGGEEIRMALRAISNGDLYVPGWMRGALDIV
jgi:DNA-binding NarL/FixJ family response regulator